jgi:asparaginyl-tRNA synthetase
MYGPYSAKDDHLISYNGNKIFGPIDDISRFKYPVHEIAGRVNQLKRDPMWTKIAKINHTINYSCNEYFHKMGALFTALPLTTRMISSPGAMYGKEAISYTTDTCPITLNWFDLTSTAFLSESSQIYLELSLMQEGVDHVYAIYNSFRKEPADATHLSEFHHIEYEGKINQKENEIVALGLAGNIINDLIRFNEEDISYFLQDNKVQALSDLAGSIKEIPRVTFREVLSALYSETKDDKYKLFTMNGTFGPWEEVKITEIYGTMVAITQFPLLEVPFYHTKVEGIEPPVANNTDFIWPGYREFIGSGQRISSTEELENKARIFELPIEDYKPYLNTRNFPDYENSSGFGLGWERLLHGLLEMPFIWCAAQFPRGHNSLKP